MQIQRRFTGTPRKSATSFRTAVFALPFSGGAFTLTFKVSPSSPITLFCEAPGTTLTDKREFMTGDSNDLLRADYAKIVSRIQTTWCSAASCKNPGESDHRSSLPVGAHSHRKPCRRTASARARTRHFGIVTDGPDILCDTVNLKLTGMNTTLFTPVRRTRHVTNTPARARGTPPLS